MSGNVVFTVGSVLRGDDAAGPMLAKMLIDNPVEGWDVVDGGQTPEDDLAVIRRMDPDRIVLIDAAEMNLEPGAVRRLTEEDVSTQFLITTHSLPITFLLAELYSVCSDVLFLGVQPGDTSFFEPLTPAVFESLELLYDHIKTGADFNVYGAIEREARVG
ncbi:MAG: hydrogenase 3 maturation endopeptidase HyCI [Raoultibacter sp.]